MLLEPQYLKEIRNIVLETIQVVEQGFDKRFDDFAGLVNRSIADTEQRLGVKIDAVTMRFDILWWVGQDTLAL